MGQAQATDATATLLQEAADALDDTARREKRAAAAHRRNAAEARRRLDTLAAAAAALGFTVVIRHSPEGTDR